MTDEDELIAAGVLIGIALLSRSRTLIRLCEAVFIPHPPPRPPKVIEWIP